MLKIHVSLQLVEHGCKILP